MLKIISTLLLTMPLLAHADGVERLRAFFDHAASMRAQFQQIVTDNRGQKVQEVDGTMQLQRPGKFRWDYNRPYQQEIVGDGKRVWLYDPELNQVTVRNMDQMLGSTPAALLAGSKAVEKDFTLENLDRGDRLQWVLAQPRQKDSGFDEVKLGFSRNGLEKMELYDSYGNLTSISFSQLEQNPALDQSVFSFTPPPGADVVGD